MTRRLSLSDSSSAPAALRDQTFEVICSCGEMLSGQRQLHHQAVPCPHCGKLVFVLPADCYAGAAPRKSPRPLTPADGASSGGVIDKLNRLAFWTRLRQGRTSLGGQLCSMAFRAGHWLKTRFTSSRG